MKKIEILYLKKLGKLLKRIREKKGHSLEYVINCTQVNDLQKIENGKNADFKSIFILCRFYEIEVEKVFDRFRKI